MGLASARASATGARVTYTIERFFRRTNKPFTTLPLTVRTQRAERDVIVSAVEHQEPDAELLNESGTRHSRITPIVRPAKWLHEIDEASAASSSEAFQDEDQFWNDPPRYSATNLASLAPAPLARVPSRRHTWSARLLFATISCAVVVLLAFELRSIAARVPLSCAHATNVVMNGSP